LQLNIAIIWSKSIAIPQVILKNKELRYFNKLVFGKYYLLTYLLTYLLPVLLIIVIYIANGRTNFCDERRNEGQRLQKHIGTRMWVNAQRDGRPAEYSWRPLFNAAKFGWRPLLECRAVTKPRRETR